MATFPATATKLCYLSTCFCYCAMGPVSVRHKSARPHFLHGRNYHAVRIVCVIKLQVTTEMFFIGRALRRYKWRCFPAQSEYYQWDCWRKEFRVSLFICLCWPLSAATEPAGGASTTEPNWVVNFDLRRSKWWDVRCCDEGGGIILIPAILLRQRQHQQVVHPSYKYGMQYIISNIFGVKECNGNTYKVPRSMVDQIVTICHIIRW